MFIIYVYTVDAIYINNYINICIYIYIYIEREREREREIERYPYSMYVCTHTYITN